MKISLLRQVRHLFFCMISCVINIGFCKSVMYHSQKIVSAVNVYVNLFHFIPMAHASEVCS